MRLLVCGGDRALPRDTVFQVLDFLTGREDVELMIHRGADGTEAAAEEWARERELASLRLPAQWKKRGERAGPVRDVQMLHLKPDLLVVFPAAPGADELVRRARDAGVLIARATERGEVTIEGV